MPGAIVRHIAQGKGDVTSKLCSVAVLASGRGTNFKAIAQSCRDEGYPARVACLITDNSDAGVVRVARSFDIPCHVIDAGDRGGRLKEGAEAMITDLCQSAAADLILLAGFMRILRGALLDRYEGRIINIHPSLLPSFPGLHAQRQALEHGVKLAGATVHFVDRSIDGGAIILQAAVHVKDEDSEESLSRRILDEENRILVQAVALVAGRKLKHEGRRVLGTTRHE